MGRFKSCAFDRRRWSRISGSAWTVTKTDEPETLAARIPQGGRGMRITHVEREECNLVCNTEEEDEVPQLFNRKKKKKNFSAYRAQIITHADDWRVFCSIIILQLAPENDTLANTQAISPTPAYPPPPPEKH